MQNRNSYKNIEDFLADESFQIWVRSNHDQSNWEEWTLQSSERAKLVEQARIWILAMKVEEPKVPLHETQIALQKTWQKINAGGKVKPKKNVFNAIWFRSVAAMFILICTSIIYFFSGNESRNNPQITYQELLETETNGLIEQTNNSDKPQLITLSDASSVLLQPLSKLSYPKTFTGADRKVYLSGEGFFEISKDKNKPFYVYANETITKVFGTSFRVKAYPNQPKVEVLVRTGKVKVTSNKALKKVSEVITLLPNQATRFSRKDLSFEKILDITIDKPLLANTNPIEQLSFEFKDTPVSQIFKTLEQAYLVDINFPKNVLKECYLTTSLIDEPLPEKLKIICESLGNYTRYEMNGSQITIQSRGCD